jgi:hypothetical protein
MVKRSVRGIDKRFFESESGSVYNGSRSALNPNPDPCIMGPDPHFFLKEGVTIVSHPLPHPPFPWEEVCHNFLNIDPGCSKISFI